MIQSSTSGKDLSAPTIQKNSSDSNGKTTSTSGGIDSVLDTLKGPKLVSTVVKSSIDWDNYKEKEGIEEDLSAAAKEG